MSFRGRVLRWLTSSNAAYILSAITKNLRLRMSMASSHREEAGVPCLGQGMGNSLLVLRYEIA